MNAGGTGGGQEGKENQVGAVPPRAGCARGRLPRWASRAPCCWRPLHSNCRHVSNAACVRLCAVSVRRAATRQRARPGTLLFVWARLRWASCPASSRSCACCTRWAILLAGQLDACGWRGRLGNLGWFGSQHRSGLRSTCIPCRLWIACSAQTAAGKVPLKRLWSDAPLSLALSSAAVASPPARFRSATTARVTTAWWCSGTTRASPPWPWDATSLGAGARAAGILRLPGAVSLRLHSLHYQVAPAATVAAMRCRQKGCFAKERAPHVEPCRASEDDSGDAFLPGFVFKMCLWSMNPAVGGNSCGRLAASTAAHKSVAAGANTQMLMRHALALCS